MNWRDVLQVILVVPKGRNNILCKHVTFLKSPRQRFGAKGRWLPCLRMMLYLQKEAVEAILPGSAALLIFYFVFTHDLSDCPRNAKPWKCCRMNIMNELTTSAVTFAKHLVGHQMIFNSSVSGCSCVGQTGAEDSKTFENCLLWHKIPPQAMHAYWSVRYNGRHY